MPGFGTVRWKAVLLVAAAVLSVAAAAWAQEGDEAKVRDLMRVRVGQPWLRIDAGGHTATVQALVFTPDSKRLCSAGLDKNVQVWNLTALRRDLRRVFLRERVIRWQVARGLRGSIIAVAVAPSDGLLAIAGYGAWDSLGEIVLVNPVNGAYVRTLGGPGKGHQQVVCSMDFSDDGNWLASSDVQGRVMLWNRVQWQSWMLADTDEKTYRKDTADLIARQPKLRPVAVAGNRYVVVPVLADARPADDRLSWKLRRLNLSDPKTGAVTFATVHQGMVTELAASADGRRLASADLAGNVYVWDVERGVPVAHLKPGATAASLAFGPDVDGSPRVLAVGTAVGTEGQGQLQLWDLERQAMVARRVLPDNVLACAISPDGTRLAYAGGESFEVFVENLDPQRAVLGSALRRFELRGRGRRVLKVAFAKDKPYYRVAFGTEYRKGPMNDLADLAQTFNAGKPELGAGAVDPADWLSSDWLVEYYKRVAKVDWTVRPINKGMALQLYRNGAAQGRVEFDPVREGRPRCYCWITDRTGKPFAIAVGTDGQNMIYVCRVVSEGVCPILRAFRGHNDYVASLSVSRDLKYLASGSADGTIRFWSLAAYQRGVEDEKTRDLVFVDAAGAATYRRWGASFAVRQNEQGEDQLVVTTIHPAGPLFRKGVRRGDVLAEIRWGSGSKQLTEKRPSEILKRLEDLPWIVEVGFTYQRDGAEQPKFPLVPAWQALATLFVSTDREWALWTPEGYYDASVNGHRMFGWQINQGLDELPDFYRADQFRKRLERGDAMEKLLEVGSLEEALALADAVRAPQAEQRKVPPEDILRDQIAGTPHIQIITPTQGSEVRNRTTQVTARIKVPAGVEVVRTKAFANGVVAPQSQKVGQQKLEDGEIQTHTWTVPLPTERQNLIQLVVGTDEGIEDFGEVLIERPDVGIEPPEVPRKLYLLAVGIDKYEDPKILTLDYSVADAEAVARQIEARSRGLYDLASAAVLANEQVTPERWRQRLYAIREKLRTASPDDLLVIYLAGHGWADLETEKYYFVGYDANLEEVLLKRKYDQCISWKDFQILADVPCRKIAVLDTCHSGAIQPRQVEGELAGAKVLHSRELKPAVRALEEDVIITITATDVTEQAVEDPAAKHGAFTKCLLDALAGKADASGDGLVDLNELIGYLKVAVPLVAKQVADHKQHPTAAPDDLLPFITLPLASTKKAVGGQGR